MKKISLMLLSVLGMGFVACDNDFDFPNPPGQTNPQEPIFENANLDMASAVEGTINLDQINNENALVSVADVKSIENLPEGYELSFVGQMAADESFTSPAEFSTSIADNRIYANPDDLDAAFHEIFKTIDPAAKKANIRYKAYAVNGSATIRLGGENVYYCPMTATMTPFNPGFTVEEEYYLIGTCTNGAIDASKAIKMNNSGVSPYDDPKFSAIIEITGDQAATGYQWAVVPRSTLTAGSGIVMGVTDSELASDPSGYLMNYTSNPIFGVINVGNTHMIEVNVRPDEDGLYSYKVQLTIPNLWTPGPANGWSCEASQQLYTENYTNYMGYVHVDGEFKFTSAPDWNHTNFGFAEAGKLSTDGGAGNINVTPAGDALTNGLYWCTANIVALTYDTTPISTIGIIGDGTAGGWDAETVMTPSEDFLTWTLKTTLKEGSFKFRANNGWDINLGGILEDLRQNGDNITVPKTGEVTITLDLSKLPYTATIK